MTENNSPIAAVLLAAGGSKRLGHPKQLVQIEGESLVQRAAKTLLATGVRPLIVVVGSGDAEVKHALEGLDVLTVFNTDWSDGIGTSIACGLSAVESLGAEFDAVLIALCDQPKITADDLTSLLDKFRSSDASIAAAEYNGTLGVPAIFAREHFPDLAALTGDSGAKKIILSAAHTIPVPMPNAELDVDTESDVAQALG